MTTRISLTFLILTIIACGQKTTPTKVSIMANDITCTISSDSSSYQKGHAPKVNVKIKNNSESSVQLVKASDGSLNRRRLPFAYFTVEKIGDTSYRRESIIRCGNYDNVDTSDFVTVYPGEIFDPYYLNKEGIFIQNGIRNGYDFIKEGKYKLKFYYSTNEPDFKKWLGESWYWYKEIDWRTNKPRTESYNYKRLFELFEMVPKMELVSNELVIEIK